MIVHDFPQSLEIKKNEPLVKYTNLAIGGPADYLASVKDQNLFIDLYRYCYEHNIRFLALGSGTNVFFPEEGFAGFVAIIQFDRATVVAKNALVVEAGATLDQINQMCIQNSLSGFEFTSGIPGTIGGAIFGNAGAYGDDVGNLLVRAKILKEGQIKFVDKNYFNFSYRHSILKTSPAIILQAEFQLTKGNSENIKTKCDSIIALRQKKLPPHDVRSAGSWFKNIKDQYGNATPAAQLLEQIGSKTTSVGDAAVHPKHANIFYNKGHATAIDMLKLQNILEKRVQEKFGITLEREVMYIT